MRGWAAGCLLWQCTLIDRQTSPRSRGYPSNSGVCGHTETSWLHWSNSAASHRVLCSPLLSSGWNKSHIVFSLPLHSHCASLPLTLSVHRPLTEDKLLQGSNSSEIGGWKLWNFREHFKKPWLSIYFYMMRCNEWVNDLLKKVLNCNVVALTKCPQFRHSQHLQSFVTFAKRTSIARSNLHAKKVPCS